MAKENFNWKSLFINESENPKESITKTDQQISSNKFPEDTNSNATGNVSNPFIAEILEVYQKGFESLNAEGFDFFELYKSVSAVGINNPQSYQMAFAMGKSLRPDITKDFLLDKSKYYISEIEKVYANYNNVGISKKNELNNTIILKKDSLNREISDLQKQIAKLQNELQSKSDELNRIDLENKEKFTEFQLKLEANNMAKQKILESISTVVSGINQYL